MDKQKICSVGGGTRTHDLIFRRDSLYPLSYTDMRSYCTTYVNQVTPRHFFPLSQNCLISEMLWHTSYATLLKSMVFFCKAGRSTALHREGATYVLCADSIPGPRQTQGSDRRRLRRYGLYCARPGRPRSHHTLPTGEHRSCSGSVPSMRGNSRRRLLHCAYPGALPGQAMAAIRRTRNGGRDRGRNRSSAGRIVRFGDDRTHRRQRYAVNRAFPCDINLYKLYHRRSNGFDIITPDRHVQPGPGRAHNVVEGSAVAPIFKRVPGRPVADHHDGFPVVLVQDVA